MIAYMKLAHIDFAQKMYRRTSLLFRRKLMPIVGLLALVLMLAGCNLPVQLPTTLPVEIPGVPKDLGELQGMLGELGIPDLSELSNVPGLDALSGLQTPPGAIAFQGPLDMALTVGQTIPGTDIRFVSAEAGATSAQFEIAGLRAPRQLGDSLDFDGTWPGASGVTYHLRLRVYQISNGQARAAGVQRVVIANVSPQVSNVTVEGRGYVMRFPHSVTANAGSTFAGMTLGYSGQDSRGAILQGLAEGQYPYRKLGDSVEWKGLLTPEIPVEYQLRMLFYQEANATVGGVAIISLPGP